MSESFFAGYEQREISIRGTPARSPLFYPRMRMMGAVFPARLRAVRALLPDARLEPLRLSPSHGLVGLHCLEYQESDIGPYNEVSVTVGVHLDARRLPSAVVALKSMVTHAYEGFVTQLPVTTEVALHGGIDVFGYPKYLADISFRETRDHWICTLRDRETKELILEAEGRRLRVARGPRTLTLHTYPQKDGELLRAKMMVRQRRYADSVLRRHLQVRLGSHSCAAALAKLGLGRPLYFSYAPQCQGILFMPESVPGD